MLVHLVCRIESVTDDFLRNYHLHIDGIIDNKKLKADSCSKLENMTGAYTSIPSGNRWEGDTRNPTYETAVTNLQSHLADLTPSALP